MIRILTASLIAAVLAVCGFVPGEEIGRNVHPEETALTLDECILVAVLYNPDVQEAFLNFKKSDNDAGIAGADYLPKFDFHYDYAWRDSESFPDKTSEHSSFVTYSQRLFEFGKESGAFSSVRSLRRNRLYTLHSVLTDVISNIRKDFYYILLKQRQLAERQVLLEEYRDKLLVARAKHEKGLILEIDVFASELNVLNEELRINEFGRSILKRKMDMRFRLGGMVPIDFRLRGKQEPFTGTEKEAIKEAERNTYYLVKLKEEIAEKEREIRESMWEYIPRITFETGYDNYRNSVSLSLGQTNNVWGFDIEAENYLDPPASRRTTYSDDSMRDVFFDLRVSVPLFDGFLKREIYQRERKDLRVLRFGYRNALEQVRLEVLKGFQTYYERKERLEIVRRSVDISRKRFEINEKLKEHGRIDDNQLETFRNAYFSRQDSFYAEQEHLIMAEENIRKYFFSPSPFIEILESPGGYVRLLVPRISIPAEGAADEIE